MKKILLLTIIFLLLAKPVLAVELTYPDIFGAQPPQVFTQERPQDEWFSYYLRYIYFFIINITGLAALYAILRGVGGYLIYGWLGQPGEMSASLKKFNVGLMGAALALGSYLILNTINPDSLSFRQEIVPPDIEDMHVGDPKDLFKNYVELPVGKLIEQVKDRSKAVDDQAAVVDSAGLAVFSQASCVKSLTDQCKCEILIVEGCECEDPTDCPECTVARCEGDPCDRDGTLCSGGSGNIRQALERARAKLSSLISELTTERGKLVAMTNNLERANQNLKIAEHLMRVKDPSGGMYNYMNFVNIKQALQEEGRKLKIEEPWPYEKDVPGFGSSSPSLHTVFECDNACVVETEETVPCCTMCENVLVCHGNDYKCDESNLEGGCENQCASEDIFPLSDGIPEDSDGWPKVDLPDSIMYNGKSFMVPSGGVRYCDINEPGCLDPKCGGIE